MQWNETKNWIPASAGMTAGRSYQHQRRYVCTRFVMNLNSSKQRFPKGWTILSLFIAGLLAAPLLVVLAFGLTPMDDIFIHLSTTVFPDALLNTLQLLFGVAIGTLLLGVSLAWMITAWEFPGRSLFEWMLILPLAIPGYVLAFVDISIFGRTGPIQSFIRELGYAMPSLPIAGAAILVMTLALYPYVYIFARNGFYTQGMQGIEAARALGQRHTFYKVALPMARPFIVCGLMLVLMETASDFGAVSILNYDTLTTLIYKAWFSLFSINAAAKFSLFMVILAFVLFLFEQMARKRRRYTTKRPAPPVRRHLKGIPAICASVGCGIVLFFAFVIPVIQLIRVASAQMGTEMDARYLGFLGRTVFFSVLAAVLITVLALGLVYAGRSQTSSKISWLVKGATLGYALPGVMLAVGGILFVTFLDRHFNKLFGATGLFLTGTIFAMMLGYMARFMALAYNAAESAMRRVTPHMDETAQSLGASSSRILRKIHFPLVRGGLVTGALLVFVDVMKEMPMTLMTRPFGWDTLAVRIFQFTSEGDWERAAIPALTLVFLGFFPVFLLTRQQIFSSEQAL